MILLLIGLIALLRFSCYKWIPYVKISLIISGSLLLIVGVLILIIPIENVEILMPIRKLVATRMFVTTVVLFILSICLSFGKKYLKNYVDKKKEVIFLEEKNEVSEEKEMEKKK